LLEGVRTFDLSKNIDARGYSCEIFRVDWTSIFGADKIVQANLFVSYPGIIRAWHKHNLGQVDYFLVLDGAIKLCAYDEKSQNLDEIISSSERLQLVRIPGHYWHGLKTIGIRRTKVIYFVNRLYNNIQPDEQRRPWNDPTIIDPKSGNAFDWNSPPFG
jgi:dTDP-4-dehydrorhamnose 3,5-epimerase